MLNFKIEILEDNTVEIFSLDTPNPEGAPFIRQPFNPETTEQFKNKEEAQTWADAFIIQFTAPPAEEATSE
jgi:hypothetical protein